MNEEEFIPVWEARFRLSDGTEDSRMFSYDDTWSDGEQQYNIECWILALFPNVEWFSVNYVEIPV